MPTTTQIHATTRYLTVRQFAEAHPWPSEHALRHYIFENTAGFCDTCVKRIGRRVLIDEAAVLDWIGEQSC